MGERVPRSRSRRRSSRAANVARLEHPGLWEDYWRFRSAAARNALVEALLPRAVNMARKALIGAIRGRRPTERPSGLGLTGDEEAALAVGLVSMVERYDPAIASLGTYMWWSARGAVIELWRKQGWFPKRWFSRGSYELRGHGVSMLSLDKIREDCEGRLDSEGAGSDQHADGWMPDALVNQDGMRETEDAVSILDECLSYLSELSGSDALVIRRRYVEDTPFKIIAEELGVTPQRVSFVHRRALVRLRELVEKS